MKYKTHLAAIGFSSIFGLTFLFSKIALDHVSPMGVIAYRFLAAFIVFELLRWFKVVHISIRRFQFRHILYVIMVQPIAYFVLETYGLNRSTSAEAGMMIAFIPIFVSILSSIFLKEKPKTIQVGFILLGVFGIMFIQWSKHSGGLDTDVLGFFLLLGAVISAALYTIFSRSASLVIKPISLTYVMILTGAVVFNSLYLVELSNLQTLHLYVTHLANVELLLSIVYLGVIASIVGFFLVNYTLGHLQAHVASIYANLATVVAIIAGATVLGEAVMYYHYIGSALIIIGVYGTVRYNKKVTAVTPIISVDPEVLKDVE